MYSLSPLAVEVLRRPIEFTHHHTVRRVLNERLPLHVLEVTSGKAVLAVQLTDWARRFGMHRKCSATSHDVVPHELRC